MSGGEKENPHFSGGPSADASSLYLLGGLGVLAGGVAWGNWSRHKGLGTLGFHGIGFCNHPSPLKRGHDCLCVQDRSMNERTNFDMCVNTENVFSKEELHLYRRICSARKDFPGRLTHCLLVPHLLGNRVRWQKLTKLWPFSSPSLQTGSISS